MGSTAPLVSIVVISHNRPEELRKCLAAAKALRCGPTEILVVDNCSDPPVCDMLRDEFPDVRVIRLHRNFGWPFAKNLASLNVAGEFIYFLDDDLYVFPDAVGTMLEVLQQRPEVGIVTGQTVDPATGKRGGLNATKEAQAGEEGCYVRNIYGGHALMRRGLLQQVGFYPDHSPYGGLDAALVLAALREGIFTWYCPTALGFHAVTRTARTPGRNFRHLYANRIHIGWRLFPVLFAVGGMPVMMFHYFVAACRQRRLLSWLLVTLAMPAIALWTLLRHRRKPVSLRTFKIYRRLRTVVAHDLSEIDDQLVDTRRARP